MSGDVSETELAFLRLLDRYGDGFDVTAPRIGRAVKSAAASLHASGHISGWRNSLSLTDLGRRALDREDR